MPANRSVPAPSTTGGAERTGTQFAEDVNDEVGALWRYTSVPLAITGTANALVGASDVPLLVRQIGNKHSFTPVFTNTGNVTLRVDGLAILPLRRNDGSEFPAGEVNPQVRMTVEDMGTEYRSDRPVLSVGAARQHLLVAHQRALGVNGGTMSNAARVVYPFNTVVENTLSGATPNTTAFSVFIGAGTYVVNAAATLYNVGYASFRMFNDTNNLDVTSLGSTNLYMSGSAVPMVLSGTLTVPSGGRSYVFHVTGSANGGSGQALGIAVNEPNGAVERYGYYSITRVS